MIVKNNKKNFTLKNMDKKLDEILEKYTSSISSQVELKLPKLKKIENDTPKLKLPKLKKITNENGISV